MRAISSGVFTMSGRSNLGDVDLGVFKLCPDDLVEGEGGIGFGKHADFHPELGLRIDRAAHGGASSADFFVQLISDFDDAHVWLSIGEYTNHLQNAYC